MTKDKHRQKIDKFRGEFIGKMLMIEVVLNKLLSAYIAQDEKFNYCDFIFTKLDIPTKLAIYKRIIKDKEPSFVDHTYVGMIQDIEEMQKIRNLFAHSTADIDFYGYKKTKPVHSKKISFRNAKSLDKDPFINIAYEYDIQEHKENLAKLNKTYDALFNVWYYYNKRHSSND